MDHCAHLSLMIRHSKVCEVFHPSPCSLFTLCNSPVLVSNFSGSSTPRATLESPVFSRRCSHRDFNFVLSARATLQEGICCKKKKFVYISFNYCVNGAIHSSLLIYLRFILIERNHAEEWLWVFKIASKREKGVFPDSSNLYWLFIYLFLLIFIDNIDWCSPQSGIPKQIWAKRFVW